jgi:ABC-type transport system, involved in lipoprotein release, permease component
MKNKLNSFITVIGLSVASACLLLIYLYVSQEIGYNSFHENKESIFRVNYFIGHADGTKVSSIYLDPKLSEILKNKIPQVKRSTAFRNAHNPSMKFENQNFEEKTFITEQDFFKIFSFKMIIGNKDKVFENPDEIVITLSLADKFAAIDSCTKEELIGKPVFFIKTGDQPFTISGIMEDVPKNSSLQFDALIPYKYEGAFNSSSNMFGNSTIFYKVTGNENTHLAEEQINKLLKEHYTNLLDEQKNRNVLINSDEAFTAFSLPITETYLSKVNTDYELKNNRTSLYILSIIGALILIIACINFVLLSLGQSFSKEREVGIRKAMGAGKRNIFSLFFTKSLIITSVSVLLGVELCFLFFPVFNEIAQNGIYTGLIILPHVFVFVIACVLFIVMSTSFFPIVKLTGIQPNQTIEKHDKGEKVNITGIFVMLQYGLSIVLIILTIAVVRQTNYMKHKDLGFSSQNILYLRVYQIDNSDKLALRDRLKNYPGITDVTLTDRDFIDGRGNNRIKNNKGEYILTRILNVDKNYVPTLNLKVIQGENFTDEIQENQSVIVNEKLLLRLGFDDNIVGQIIQMDGKNLRISGVVKDFHFDSLKEEIEPLMLILRTYTGDRGNFLFIKYRADQLDKVMQFILETWKDIAPGKELDFKLWDEQLNQRYKAEEKWSKIIGYASLVSIIISSLGLLGLTLLVINRRVKEIGIRKINGARISEVMVMLNTTFIRWVTISFIIACPIAWYVMHKWLENFAYKEKLSWWIFALAGIIALGTALLTVSWQSWRAATRNPVEALRYE